MTVPVPDAAIQEARYLLRAVPQGALATIMRQSAGAPYASLVLLASDHDGTPLLLLSDLADHTKNLAEEPRVSLLLDGSAGHEDPLAGARLTLQGRLETTAEPRHRARYLARHPMAKLYAGFGDFRLWRMAVERGHLVAGFGRIHWLPGGRLIGPEAPALRDGEADIVEHMNQDHGEALQLYATRLLGRAAGSWQMTGIDPDGLDLRSGSATARLAFDAPVTDPGAARTTLIQLVARARAAAQADEGSG